MSVMEKAAMLKPFKDNTVWDTFSGAKMVAVLQNGEKYDTGTGEKWHVRPARELSKKDSIKLHELLLTIGVNDDKLLPNR